MRYRVIASRDGEVFVDHVYGNDEDEAKDEARRLIAGTYTSITFHPDMEVDDFEAELDSFAVDPDPAPLPLFLIQDDDRDLVVAANDVVEAIGYWHSYFDTLAEEDPERVFEIDPNGCAGALGWHNPNGGGVVREVKEVAASEVVGVGFPGSQR